MADLNTVALSAYSYAKAKAMKRPAYVMVTRGASASNRDRVKVIRFTPSGRVLVALGGAEYWFNPDGWIRGRPGCWTRLCLCEEAELAA